MGIIGDEFAKGITELIKNEGKQTNEIFGMLFPYAGIKQKAIDLYLNEIEKSNLPLDTKVFMVLNTKKEFKRIKNQKAIAEKAISIAREGTDFSEKSGINGDWFNRFMDSAGLVSSEEMQLIWSKILAGEFEHPGSTPPNMIRILSEITPELAKAFRIICSMSVKFIPLKENGDAEEPIEMILVPFDQNSDIFQKKGLGFDTINELETLGVLKFDSIAGYVSKGFYSSKALIQVDGRLRLIEQHPEGVIPCGNVILTAVGNSLKSITDKLLIDNYYEMVDLFMNKHGVRFAKEHDYIIEEGDEVLVIRRS